MGRGEMSGADSLSGASLRRAEAGAGILWPLPGAARPPAVAEWADVAQGLSEHNGELDKAVQFQAGDGEPMDLATILRGCDSSSARAQITHSYQDFVVGRLLGEVSGLDGWEGEIAAVAFEHALGQISEALADQVSR